MPDFTQVIDEYAGAASDAVHASGKLSPIGTVLGKYRGGLRLARTAPTRTQRTRGS